MSWLKSSRYFACAALLAAFAARGRAQSTLQELNYFANYSDTYNLISFGNVALNGSSDTQGGIAVGGNLSIGGSWTIASTYSTDPDPSLFVAGSLSIGSGTMENEGYATLTGITTGTASNQWTWSSSAKKLTSNTGGQVLSMNSSDSRASDDPTHNPIPPGWSWSTEQSEFDSVSTSLAGASVGSDTISVDSGGNIQFNTTVTHGVAVFDLDAAQLCGNQLNGQTIQNFAVNVPSGVNYVINVTGLTQNEDLFSGITFNSGSNDSNLLWNLESTTGVTGVTIDPNGNLYGAVLAPTLNVTDDTTINGQVVADSFTDNGVELHDTTFTPEAVLVPEPSGFALGALALCGALIAHGLIVRRRAVRNQPRAALVPLASSVSK
jgi:choice-of-anchor A domain-containing protein